MKGKKLIWRDRELKCGCIPGYHLCPDARKVWLSPTNNVTTDQLNESRRLLKEHTDSQPPMRSKV